MEQRRAPRMTIPTQLVLRALLADPSRELYGVEIGTAAGLPSGTIHPILARAYPAIGVLSGGPT
jgi:PadR family transcriptional regulator, regulatory protein PadR